MTQSVVGPHLFVQALACCVAVGGCRGGDSPRKAATSRDAAQPAVGVDATPGGLNAPAPIDAMPVFDAPRPKVAAEFEAAMDDLMKRPPSPERSQLTCLFIKKKREVFRLPASIQRPERVPEEEWRQAQIEYGETEIDIAEMCEDMDGKPEGGEDEEVLRLLRQRYEKLVSLTRDP